MRLKLKQAELCAALLCAMCWLSAKRAQSAPLTAAISVEKTQPTSDCPDEIELTRSVERILQRSLTSSLSNQDALRVAVRFSGVHDDYSAEVRSLGAKPGERRFHDRGRSCAALAEAVSVAIALLLDQELQRQGAGAAEAAASPPPVTQPKTLEPVLQRDRPVERSALELRATVEAGVSSGLSGTHSTLLSEQLGLRYLHSLTLDAGFNAVLPATTSYGAGAVRTTLLFASLRACYTWGLRFSVGPCAQLGVGRLRGNGVGYASVQSENLLWTAVGAGVVAEGPVWGRVFWGAAGSVWLPTQRSSFSVENAGTAWESRTIGAGLSVRLGFRIW